MNEAIGYFQGLRPIKQAKRRSNLEYSTELLHQTGVPFTAHNGGTHLVVQSGVRTIDFWPSTGLWTVRGAATRNRGVRGLLAHLRKHDTINNNSKRQNATETQSQPVTAH